MTRPVVDLVADDADRRLAGEARLDRQPHAIAGAIGVLVERRRRAGPACRPSARPTSRRRTSLTSASRRSRPRDDTSPISPAPRCGRAVRRHIDIAVGDGAGRLHRLVAPPAVLADTPRSSGSRNQQFDNAGPGARVSRSSGSTSTTSNSALAPSQAVARRTAVFTPITGCLAVGLPASVTFAPTARPPDLATTHGDRASTGRDVCGPRASRTLNVARPARRSAAGLSIGWG